MNSALSESIKTARPQYVAKIVTLLTKRPSLSYREVAERTGASPRTVDLIAAGAGIKRRRGRKLKK